MRLCTAVQADVLIPADLADAISDARTALEAVGGRVSLDVPFSEFGTWWATRARGRHSTEIEFAPQLHISVPERAVYAGLVYYDNDRGKLWAHSDMVRRMVAWVLGTNDGLPCESVTYPLSDEQLALDLAALVEKGEG